MARRRLSAKAQNTISTGRIAIAIGIAAASFAIRYALHPFLGEQQPYIFLYPAVLIAGMIGGGSAAAICLACGFIPSMYFFDAPVNSFEKVHPGGVLSAVMVLGLIAYASSMQRRERQTSDALRKSAEANVETLQYEIMERKRTEEALRHSEQELRLLIESAIDYAIFTINHTGIITGWNVGATRLLGYSEQDILGEHFRIVFTPEDQRLERAEKEMVMAAEQGRAEDERWHLRNDGSEFWASGVITPMRDDDGRLMGFVKIMRDMTARREAELALRESEERYRRLAELSPDAMLVILDSQVVYANVAARTLLGIERDDSILNHSVFDFIHRDYHRVVEDRVRMLLNTGESAPSIDEKFVRTDGIELDVEAVATLVPWKGKEAIQVILHDVTERKRNEESLRRASELHRLLLRELDHRVRNNLASLIALIEITSSGKTNVREVAGAIRNRTQAMAAVHQLLSKQHWTTVDLSSLIEALRPPSAPGELRTQGPSVAIASRQVTALGMVLQELFSNSTKYGALGVIEGTVVVQWTIHEHEDRILELHWIERGGPAPTSDHPQAGVGSGLIKGFVRSELRGQATLSYPPEGANHRFTLHLDPLPELSEAVV